MDEKDLASKKVIFCVHGKLSGCCTLVKGRTGEDCPPIDYRQNPAFCELLKYFYKKNRVNFKTAKSKLYSYWKTWFIYLILLEL